MERCKIQWLCDYLRDRKQKGRCGISESTVIPLDVCLLQDSILEPLLFILYNNDLGDYINSCKFHFFADDTIIYLSGKDIKRLVENLNNKLHTVFQWLVVNKLKVYINKTKCLLLANKSGYSFYTSSKLSIRVDDKVFVEKINYLGVITK